MKKTVLITISFCLVFLLTACSNEPDLQPKNVINLDSGIDHDEAEVAAKLGFALPDDAEVTAAVNNSEIYLIELRSQMSVDELVQFFTNEMKNADYEQTRDWEALTEQENTKGSVYSKNNKPVSFSIRGGDNLRSISIQQIQ